MKTLIIHFIIFKVIFADIRLDNNQLAGEGKWKKTIDSHYSQQSRGQLSNQNNVQQQKKSNITDQQQVKSTQNEITQYNNEIFQQFKNSQGSCFVFFYDSNLRDSFQNKQKVDSLSIRFHDPKYIDQKIIVMKISLERYVMDTDLWEDKDVVSNYTFFDELEIKTHGSISLSYKINHQQIQIYLGKQKISIEYQEKQYSVIFPLVILALNFVLLYAMIRIEKREIAVERISIFTLYHCIFFLIYLSTFFMIIGMADLPKPMSLLLLCGCLQILISVKLIRKFEAIIQRISNINGYCIFYCGIFVYVWCLFNYYYSPVFIILNSLFLVPQIVHNLKNGNRLGNEYEYIVILVSTQLYFIYLKGYSDNVLRYHPQPLVCAAIVILVILQVVVIYYQNKKGPYFFIRKNWLPNYFEYYKKQKLDSKSNLYQHQCPICLCSLAEEDPMTVAEKQTNITQQELSQKSKNLNQIKQVTIMITPCQHKFHPICLEQWMEHKRQCPVDRSSLPILYK